MGISMKPKLRRFFYLALFLVVFPAAASVKDDQGSIDLWKRYNAAVLDSAVYRHENLRPLRPLKFNPETLTITVVTLTNYDYPMGEQSLSRAVWVTAVPE